MTLRRGGAFPELPTALGTLQELCVQRGTILVLQVVSEREPADTLGVRRLTGRG